MSNCNTNADVIEAVEIEAVEFAKATAAHATVDATAAATARAAAYTAISRPASDATARAEAYALAARAAAAAVTAAATARAAAAAHTAIATDADASYTELIQLLEQLQPEQLDPQQDAIARATTIGAVYGFDGSVITA